MNDRFKFRIWDKKLKKIAKWGDNPYHNMEIMNYICVENPVTDWKHEDYILMQCTGLKDKNGKLIYEGDILGGIYNGYIEYCDECKCFQLKVKDYGCLACEGDLHWYELVEAEEQNELEVIGNIYENKELLESEE